MLIRRSWGARIAAAFSFALLLLTGFASASDHVRGTLSAVKDGAISVKTASGAEDFKVGAETPLFLVSKADISAVKSGKFVGITSVEKNGKRVAKEVHVFADSLRGLAEGHYPWDLEGDANMMTNANIATINEVGADRELKLNYNGGEQMIAVPESAAIVAFDKCGADQLVAGRKLFIILKKDTKDIAAVVIGAEGVKPPM